MNMLRISVRAALAVLLLLTSVGMGAARGQAPVAGHMELCGSFGQTMVAVDAQGNVVTAPGHCPDCAGLLLAVATPALPTPVRAARVVCLTPALAVWAAPAAGTALPPPARAPPVGIAA